VGFTSEIPVDVFARDCFPDEKLYATMDSSQLTAGCDNAESYTEVFETLLSAAEEYNPILKGIDGSVCFCNGDACNGCSNIADCGGGGGGVGMCTPSRPNLIVSLHVGLNYIKNGLLVY